MHLLCKGAAMFGMKDACHKHHHHGIKKGFVEHMNSQGLSYGTKEEFMFRLNIYAENDAIIKKSNAEEQNFTLGHNFLSTMTEAEKSKLNGLRIPKNYKRNPVWIEETNADAVDWRTKGAVTPVKNQGQCGSCWAFSTTGSTEGANFLKTGKLVSLSEQQLVDCDTKQDQGCNGGLMDNAFKYIETHKLDTEASYPYKGKDGKCHIDKATQVGTVTKYTDVTSDNAAQLKAAITIGPVSIAVEADKSVFQQYQTGILDSKKCGTQLDHGVLAVGYGTNYFIVKNSWGASWGDKGYLKISSAKGKGGKGICGILMQPSYPTA